MPGEPIPAVIMSLIDATNSADEQGFVGVFTADAQVEDGGRVFSGQDGVAQWNRTDNIGVGMHFDLLAWADAGPDAFDVTLRASSRRFSGTGAMHIILREGLISRLVIA